MEKASVTPQRETFIPFRRRELIKLCLDDNRLDTESTAPFEDFCEILAAFYHFRAHALLERLKENYTPFNPDREHRQLEELPEAGLQESAELLATGVTDLLEKASIGDLIGFIESRKPGEIPVAAEIGRLAVLPEDGLWNAVHYQTEHISEFGKQLLGFPAFGDVPNHRQDEHLAVELEAGGGDLYRDLSAPGTQAGQSV